MNIQNITEFLQINNKMAHITKEDKQMANKQAQETVLRIISQAKQNATTYLLQWLEGKRRLTPKSCQYYETNRTLIYCWWKQKMA